MKFEIKKIIKLLVKYFIDSIFYKIYFEWIYKLTILFCLTGIVVCKMFEELTAIVAWFMISLFVVASEKEDDVRWYNFFRTISMLLWLGIYAMSAKYYGSLFFIPKNWIIVTLFMFLFFIPVTLYLSKVFKKLNFVPYLVFFYIILFSIIEKIFQKLS